MPLTSGKEYPCQALSSSQLGRPLLHGQAPLCGEDRNMTFSLRRQRTVEFRKNYALSLGAISALNWGPQPSGSKEFLGNSSKLRRERHELLRMRVSQISLRISPLPSSEASTSLGENWVPICLPKAKLYSKDRSTYYPEHPRKSSESSFLSRGAWEVCALHFPWGEETSGGCSLNTSRPVVNHVLRGRL